MISLAVFLLKPNIGSIACTEGFMIQRQCSFEKEVTARGYCMAGSQIFLYSGNALIGDMDDLVTLDTKVMLFPLLNLTLSVGSPAGLLYTPSCRTESVSFSIFPVPPDEPP
eukprot:1070220-Ditylum_brightwellii.AAC.1